MQVFVQLLITGVAMGFIYALVGIEYTLIWNSTAPICLQAPMY